MRPLLAAGLILAILLGVAGIVTLAYSWGSYTELEYVEIPYHKFNSDGVTWYTFQKAYSDTVYLGIRNLLTYNSSATEQKAVLWFGTTDYHVDIVFFGNGAVDINDVSSGNSTKIGGFSGWDTYDYLIVKFNLDDKTLAVLDPNGTVLANVTYSTSVTSISQVGASGIGNAVTAGSVVVAVLQAPIDVSEIMSGTMDAVSSLIYAIVPIIIVIGLMSAVLGIVKGLFKNF